MNTVGKRIRAARQQLGYTQSQAAEKCGLNVSLYKQYELGIKIPKDSQLEKISRALGVEFESLRPPKIETISALLYALREIDDRYGSVIVSEDGQSVTIKLTDLQLTKPSDNIALNGTTQRQGVADIQEAEINTISPDHPVAVLPSEYLDKELAIRRTRALKDCYAISEDGVEQALECLYKKDPRMAIHHLEVLQRTLHATKENDFKNE